MPPLLPWPGTPGGAASPDWDDRLRLYVYAAIQSGAAFRWGPDPQDKLDAGNVYGPGEGAPGPPVFPGRLWIDLTCDVLDLETHLGGARPDGVVVTASAGTAQITLRDPTRKYDPLNPASPYQYGGRSRLMPGTPVTIWVEYVPDFVDNLLTEAGANLVTEAGDVLVTEGSFVRVDTYRLHTGTVDTWSAPWDAHPEDRRATVISSDAVKDLVALDRGEQPPVGAGDTVNGRIERVLSYYGWAGARRLDTSVQTLQATTMDKSAWDLIGHASEDEAGFVYVDAWGVLQFHNRDTWSTSPDPTLEVGCGPAFPDAHDILIEADVVAVNLNIRNAVYASISGGVTQGVRAEESIVLYGEHSYKRTDLGLQTNEQAGAWATFVVALQGWPRARVDRIELKPHYDGTSWEDILGLVLVDDRVRIIWSPPDNTPPVETIGRSIGIDHRISRHSWDTDVYMVLADLYRGVLHWGVHPNDKLDNGYVFR